MAVTLELPLISDPPGPATWQGFRPTVPSAGWDAADSAPEPAVPQGEYGHSATANPNWLESPSRAHAEPARAVELLAPAGGPDSAFAAFHHGADAIYLGLKHFSARAEAENFTLEQVGEVTAYAHALLPRRRVFVTINTVLRQDELPELVSDLAALAAIGVDALIVQDLGVAAIARRHFPEMELHASTQLAVHNRAGAIALGQLGFARVVLARELTIEEVHDITAARDIETEVFVHGALCYSYSGLCLFSSQTLGRSGNRGKCAYSCRDSYTVADAPDSLRNGSATRRNPESGFPFSMKDLALPDHLPVLRSAGVSCFKIEGRKKSPLYVATTTNYYRGLLQGAIAADDRAKREAELQTVFSRPWTKLFVQSHKDKEVADRDTVGHRGALVGQVEAIHSGRLKFNTSRALERHDGLQVDLPALGKPFGFPVDDLWVAGPGGKLRSVVAAPAGASVEVGLPVGHPQLPVGGGVYCSSSQEVKRKYRYDRPKPGLYRPRQMLDITVRLSADRISAAGKTANGVTAEVEVAGPLAAAKDPSSLPAATRSAFAKLGDSNFSLGNVTLENPDGRFVPISQLNQLRRSLSLAMTGAVQAHHQKRIDAVQADVVTFHSAAKPEEGPLLWSIKTDRLDHLAAFDDEDWAGVEEVVVDIDRDHAAELASGIDRLAGKIGRERIRLALPAVTRKWEERGLLLKAEMLRSAGWRKWEASNLSAWTYLDPLGELDLATDWPIYVMNRAASHAVRAMGVQRFALSPEDGKVNMAALLAEFAEQAVVIVHQDTPLFIAESCAYANLIGGCPGKANCRFESMEMESSHGERVTALDYHCRTIVLNRGPFCLSGRLKEIARMGVRHVRADFIFRRYTAEETRDRWQSVRAGRCIAGSHVGNFDRGIL